MKIETQLASGYALLRLAGDFETYAVGEFLAAIQAARDSGRTRVVLNLRRVKFINSTGIGAVLRARKELKSVGGGLALARSSGFVRQVFGKLGLDSVLPQYEEEEDAAEALLATETREVVGPVDPGEEDPALFFRFYDQVRADLLGKKGVGAGEISLLDPKGITFTWNGRRREVGEAAMSKLFAPDTEIEIKFRLPLYKKGAYFVSTARVETSEVKDGVARVQAGFVKLDDEAAKAVRQYVADISLVRDELEQARRGG